MIQNTRLIIILVYRELGSGWTVLVIKCGAGIVDISPISHDVGLTVIWASEFTDGEGSLGVGSNDDWVTMAVVSKYAVPNDIECRSGYIPLVFRER